MKYVSKIDLEGLDGVHLIKGKLYEIKETPKMIDPVTYDKITGYPVLGEKGWFKINIDSFISLEELRDQKIDDLLKD